MVSSPKVLAVSLELLLATSASLFCQSSSGACSLTSVHSLSISHCFVPTEADLCRWHSFQMARGQEFPSSYFCVRFPPYWNWVYKALFWSYKYHWLLEMAPVLFSWVKVCDFSLMLPMPFFPKACLVTVCSILAPLSGQDLTAGCSGWGFSMTAFEVYQQRQWETQATFMHFEFVFCSRQALPNK